MRERRGKGHDRDHIERGRERGNVRERELEAYRRETTAPGKRDYRMGKQQCQKLYSCFRFSHTKCTTEC
jgi:hypothetical protein